MKLELVVSPKRNGLTRVECLAIGIAIGFLGLITLPVWARDVRQSDLASCFNNLRQLGQAMRLWAHDHGDSMPWRVLESRGGTMPDTFSKPGRAWVEWYSFRYELESPKVLVCPSDGNRRPASDWSRSLTEGFLGSKFQDNAVSYILGADTFSEFGALILSGDRNLKFDGRSGCSAGFQNVARWYAGDRYSEASWTNGLHSLGGSTGQLLFNDGHVKKTVTSDLTEYLKASEYDNRSTHFLVPY